MMNIQPRFHDEEIASESELVCDEMTRSLLMRMGCSDDTATLCALAVSTQAQGNVCLGPLEQKDCDILSHYPNVISDDGTRPFVLKNNLLYTRRNWLYEQTVIQRMTEMSAQTFDNDIDIPTDGIFQNMGQRQRDAVQMMCSRQFSLLTGGPGTGKTYTIARAVLLSRRTDSRLRLGLAAPTGKAAARVKEAMTAEANNLGLNDMPPATTIHSLLQSNYDLVTFKHNKANPLPLDWLIVDEASMIDLPLMAKLLDALPPNCRLTLVGDAHQLASVEPGRVFGDLCRMAGLPKCELDVSRRFPQGGEIERLSAAVNTGDGETALTMLKNTDNQLLHYTSLANISADNPQFWSGFDDNVKKHFQRFADSASPEEALKALNDCRILCAMRHGPYGMTRLNTYVKSILDDNAPIPMMIVKNNHSLGVNNGDVGVVIPKLKDDSLHLYDGNGNVRSIRLALLPELEMAFASTIHKAQGSEYENVIIVLPPYSKQQGTELDNPLLTREILYTAITRTQKGVFLYGGDDSIRTCCAHAIKRQTGMTYTIDKED
ncbi:MAG: exodeoxyribonuclease V subunit alpha [Victivallales bacterium]|nr:exodeoxyribonuclease V subunit alpha [Victivallales bacterium]